MNKTFIWIVGIIIAIVALMWMGKATPGMKPPFEIGVVHPLDNIKGNKNSKVIVTEYSDFQCPACRTYYPVMREVTTEFKDEALFIYRHFPLTSIHQNAEFAARAAEAAGKQGKFWEMHDLLFEKQNEWASAVNVKSFFESYAELISISAEQFKSDFASSEVRDLVKAQRTHAIQSGLKGTPTFFINDKQIESPRSIEEFKSAIREAINNSK